MTNYKKKILTLYNKFCDMPYPNTDDEYLEAIIEDNLDLFDGYFAGIVKSFIDTYKRVETTVLIQEIKTIKLLFQQNKDKCVDKNGNEYCVKYLLQMQKIVEEIGSQEKGVKADI